MFPQFIYIYTYAGCSQKNHVRVTYYVMILHYIHKC